MRPSARGGLLPIALLFASGCSDAASRQASTDAGADAATPQEAGEPADGVAVRIDGTVGGNGTDAGALQEAGRPGEGGAGRIDGAVDRDAADAAPDGLTPNVADNPPVPVGWQLMMQSAVTPEMTAWAVAILNDPGTYPMFATTLRTFGLLRVMARVEWRPPDFQNGTVHRGVTLYEPG
jgi:hypothetical protein